MDDGMEDVLALALADDSDDCSSMYALLFDDSDDNDALSGSPESSIADSDGSTCTERPQSTTPLSHTTVKPRRREQLRPHSEIMQLREQLIDLEAHAAQLRRYCGVNTSPACGSKRRRCTAADTTSAQCSAAVARSFAAAVHASALRRRAERWNARLRAAVDEQLQSIAALQQLLQFRLSDDDAAVLTDVKRQNASGDWTVPVATPSDISMLLATVDALYAATTDIVGRIAAARDVARPFHASVSHGGQSRELTTNTPVPWPRATVAHFLWQLFERSADVEFSATRLCHAPSDLASKAPPMSDGQFLTFVATEVVGDRVMRKRLMLRTFVERQRTIFTLAVVIAFSGTDLVVREDAWVVLSDMDPLSTHGASTLLQTHYRTYAAQRDASGDSDVALLETFMLGFATDHMRANKLALQQFFCRQQSLLLHEQQQTSTQQTHRHAMGFGCVTCEYKAAAQLRTTYAGSSNT